MSRTDRCWALLILALALALLAAAPAASGKRDDRCCKMSWALDYKNPARTYLPGVAALWGHVKIAGKASGAPYLLDERGNTISKKGWVCRGYRIEGDGIAFSADLDTRRLKRGHLYYWIVESKSRK